MEELTPITRREVFLAKASGQEVETPTPVTREEVFLDAIVKGGGSSLPSTETASAGDVLSLDDNKKPQWATPSGGGGVLYVTASQDRALDKNFEEIQTALDGGKVVMLKRESLSDGVFYAQLFKAASFPEAPYYCVAFYDFSMSQGIFFSNTTSPTDPLVYEE